MKERDSGIEPAERVIKFERINTTFTDVDWLIKRKSMQNEMNKKN